MLISDINGFVNKCKVNAVVGDIKSAKPNKNGSKYNKLQIGQFENATLSPMSIFVYSQPNKDALKKLKHSDCIEVKLSKLVEYKQKEGKFFGVINFAEKQTVIKKIKKQSLNIKIVNPKFDELKDIEQDSIIKISGLIIGDIKTGSYQSDYGETNYVSFFINVMNIYKILELYKAYLLQNDNVINWLIKTE
eukprot:163733_1